MRYTYTIYTGGPPNFTNMSEALTRRDVTTRFEEAESTLKTYTGHKFCISVTDNLVPGGKHVAELKTAEEVASWREGLERATAWKPEIAKKEADEETAALNDEDSYVYLVYYALRDDDKLTLSDTCLSFHKPYHALRGHLPAGVSFEVVALSQTGGSSSSQTVMRTHEGLVWWKDKLVATARARRVEAAERHTEPAENVTAYSTPHLKQPFDHVSHFLEQVQAYKFKGRLGPPTLTPLILMLARERQHRLFIQLLQAQNHGHGDAKALAAALDELEAGVGLPSLGDECADSPLLDLGLSAMERNALELRMQSAESPVSPVDDDSMWMDEASMADHEAEYYASRSFTKSEGMREGEAFTKPITGVDCRITMTEKPPHYQRYIKDMQWFEAMQYVVKPFRPAAEIQIRKYLDRLGQKNDELEELLKARWYLNFLVAYTINGGPIRADDVAGIIQKFLENGK